MNGDLEPFDDEGSDDDDYYIQFYLLEAFPVQNPRNYSQSKTSHVTWQEFYFPIILIFNDICK